MRFSLIVSTLGRVEQPRRLFASLDRQSFRDFEVVIVDQNSDHRLEPVINEFLGRFELRHLRDNGRGCSRGRNLGIRWARGEILSFPDDDCWYPGELLGTLNQVCQRNPGWDAVSVPVMDESGTPALLRWPRVSSLINRNNVWNLLLEASTFYRKDLLHAVQGFDEALGAGAGTPWGAGEGSDLALRAIARRYHLQYHPVSYVMHANQARDETTTKKAYSYSAGMGRVMRVNHYPVAKALRLIVQPLIPVMPLIVLGKPGVAAYYWNVFVGRAAGWFDATPHIPVLPEEHEMEAESA